MLRSLFSGVTGLQSHQVAMDVESNNIANVNTIGFKYSRANFSDLLAQTGQISTAPQDNIGGKNSVQIGLGTSVNSITKIMTQGSIQNTDKNTDVAIQGDGFFIVSSDGGNTKKYTRSGDFKFDANGNFVDNNGFIVQGWLKNSTTGLVDSTAPITNVVITPGLTTPANPSTKVVIKANLDSGDTVETFGVTKAMKTYNFADYLASLPAAADTTAQADALKLHDANVAAAEDLSVMFNEQGYAFGLQENQGIWISYKDAKSVPITIADTANTTFSFKLNGTAITGSTGAGPLSAGAAANAMATAINTATAKTGVVATAIAGSLTLTNDNSREGDQASTKNIIIADVVNGLGLTAGNSVTTAYIYQYSANANEIQSTVVANSTFKTTEQLRLAMETHAKDVVGGTPSIQSTTISVTGTMTAGTISAKVDGVTYLKPFNTNTATTLTDLANAIAAAHPTFTVTPGASTITIVGPDQTTPFVVSDVNITAATGLTSSAIVENAIATTGFADNIQVILNDRGQYEVTNTKDIDSVQEDLKLQITGYTVDNSITKNERFTDSMQALNGTVVEGGSGVRLSQALNLATHSASVDIYDSLGSKHTLTMNFRKTAVDKTAGTTWDVKLTVPGKAEISDQVPLNEKLSQIRFSKDGALSSPPVSIDFTANNGSSPLQKVTIDFGTPSTFDGITSFDAPSSTSGISQDGYQGGDLVGVRIDQSGTLIGSFTNGRSFGLAQIGMAKFTNNEGLLSDGGNVYLQSANSGEATIGTAATAGRGFIQASSLEASNVDLSKSLTNLIIIQRGYQANGKTITTSDALLETLLGIKR